jgi:hypothetical protein
MLEEMEAGLLAKIEACPEFGDLVIGLAQEAADRNVI